jgi:hypothetical protein
MDALELARMCHILPIIDEHVWLLCDLGQGVRNYRSRDTRGGGSPNLSKESWVTFLSYYMADSSVISYLFYFNFLELFGAQRANKHEIS